MIRRRAYIKRSRPVRASTRNAARKQPKRGARIAARNPKRHKTNWARAYHSAARVAFVKSLPCVACGHEPPARCVNAHTYSGGMGRKADYLTIVPLCAPCHVRQHAQGWNVTLSRNAQYQTIQKPNDLLAALAADTEAKWQAFQETSR